LDIGKLTKIPVVNLFIADVERGLES